ncbi:DNA polymerase III beta subunit [Agrilactobacillus composti DSM 18527 = JCM 14202]|uniref:Beta sliding clamp n=1 Tax=Agrilactobacillus composti DSM 18527 = JCM 14202 TaxID=1423734 RepID=A0A0R1XXX9_9LACO|nr:DNA polymerase III subunit beta [Agrilactobacillus composti]KRM35006.1 DNA polymerase III beta subunit [Agrilactobacillus composti DSM 18527 = JCM 14202]
MKFSINRSRFIKTLNDVQRAIASKATIPILTGLKMSLSEEGLTLTGSDADISIEAMIANDDPDAQLQINETGAIVLPARFFGEIVKKLPEQLMTIAVSDGFQTTITSGASSFNINGLDANSYPRLPEISAEEKLTIPADILKQVISQTVIAVSNQESRPILTGVHLTVHDTELLAVATDSHRLSQRKLTIENPHDLEYDVIIPGKSLTELAKIITDDLESVTLRITENQVLFTAGVIKFYSRLLEGSYPDTERLIPTESTTNVEFESGTLLASVERASLLSHASQNNVVRLVFEPENQQATIYSNSPELGNVQEDLKFESLTGEKLDISFNPDYMKDALRSFGQTNIKMAFTSALRPFTLIPSEDGANFVQLITPVRTF